MTKLVGTALIVSFLAIAVFGFLAMGEHGDSGLHSRCITETAAGQMCPNNPFAAAVFHISVFKSFSQVVFGNGTPGVFILLGVLALFTLSFLRREILALLSLVAQERRRNLLAYEPIPSEKNLLRWLALHENSPSLR